MGGPPGYPPGPARISALLVALLGGVYALGTLLRVFEAHPAYARTAIIVTSDHGEALFERGWGNHGNSLFEGEIHVPMAARLPGVVGPRRYTDPVSLVDVMPTLCVYLGAECPSRMTGISLVSLPGVVEQSAPRYLVADGAIWRPELRALRNARLKLMVGQAQDRPGAQRGYALYDLRKDPRETRNLLSPPHASQRAKDAAASMARALTDAVPLAALPRRTVPLDADQVERLRALGYLQ